MPEACAKALAPTTALFGCTGLPVSSATSLDGSHRVGHRKAEVVVAVDREQRVFAATSVRDDAAHDPSELAREAVASGVRDVDDGRARRDHRFYGFDQVVEIRAARVFGRILNPVAKGPRISNHLGAALEYLSPRHAELALDVYIGYRQHDVDLRRLRLFDSGPDCVDVFFDRASERGDGGATNFTSDPPARLKVAWRTYREAGLDYVDAELLELARDGQLGVRIQVEP